MLVMEKPDDTVFSFFLNDPNFAVATLLGEHDDTFKCFASYVSKIWTKRSDF